MSVTGLPWWALILLGIIIAKWIWPTVSGLGKGLVSGSGS